MRLVELSTLFTAERAADSQAVAASQMLGSQASGSGARTAAIEKIEADESTGVRGGVAKRHPTSSELKRYLWAKNGPAKKLRALIGRD